MALRSMVFMERAVDHFLVRGGRQLRLGYTTGTCAALAAHGAVRMLLTGEAVAEASLVTPKGIRIAAPLREVFVGDGEARCGVVKDAGDDPDVTDGVLVCAAVRRCAGSDPDSGIVDVVIDGGEGVGRVTRAGLDQPVGAAAINSVPRQMIADEVRGVCRELGHTGGISVVISIPGGEALAARTFNPHLGITGGLSVIGTSGIVEPMSTQAIIDTVRAELSVLRARGEDKVALVPGNYGEAFLAGYSESARRDAVKCSNFIGEALDAAVALGFVDILIAGHVGKLIKLSGGVMDTHSRVADCRAEFLALGAAAAGAEAPLVRRVLEAATVDEGLGLLGEALRRAVMDFLVERAERYCRRRAGDGVSVRVIMFSNMFGMFGKREGAGG